MQLRRLSDEVLVADASIVQIGRGDIDDLKQRALENPRRRIRICAHVEATDRPHEMLIVHTRGAYVRPHKHLGKSESLHVIEGEAEVVFFDDDGGVSEVVPLGDYESGRRFYYRIDTPLYHTLLITTEFFVFHEVTSGPFLREETLFAPWAPEESAAAACAAFQHRLVDSIGARG